jgi:hypothetical protein
LYLKNNNMVSELYWDWLPHRRALVNEREMEDIFLHKFLEKLLQQWMVYIHHRYNPVSESRPCQRSYV